MNKMKYKYRHEFNFHDEKSWSDERLDCNEELVIKSEREEKGRLDVRNKANRLGDNGVKGKGMEVKIYDYFDEAVMKCMRNDRGDSKRKVGVSKVFKDKDMQRKTNKRKKHTKRLKNEHLPKIRITHVFDRGRILLENLWKIMRIWGLVVKILLGRRPCRCWKLRG